MAIQRFSLEGHLVRLDPLDSGHIPGLMAAAAVSPGSYRWTTVPQGRTATEAYVATALAARDAGTAVPFATIRRSDSAVIGSTRFFNNEYWPWPAGHSRHGRDLPDACEIGYTWLTAPAQRTGINSEAKLLMLTHAFEAWDMLRVCLHTDERNQQSRTAMERMGAQFEGILRAHRIASDFIARNSARYSVTAAEWPAVKAHLEQRRDRHS